MRHAALITLLVVLVLTAGCTGLDTINDPSTSIPDGSPPPSSTEATGHELTPVESPNGSLAVHALNVGQGDAMLVIGPTGETMLIDSGDWGILEFINS